ncbi:hypothetical protein C8Q75DRAFT_741252 [Abortiporus biennis]|nr:hypothetical protein C8Q75DRAFT_741252 [Abortiporus biennis]
MVLNHLPQIEYHFNRLKYVKEETLAYIKDNIEISETTDVFANISTFKISHKSSQYSPLCIALMKKQAKQSKSLLSTSSLTVSIVQQSLSPLLHQQPLNIQLKVLQSNVRHIREDIGEPQPSPMVAISLTISQHNEDTCNEQVLELCEDTSSDVTQLELQYPIEEGEMIEDEDIEMVHALPEDSSNNQIEEIGEGEILQEIQNKNTNNIPQSVVDVGKQITFGNRGVNSQEVIIEELVEEPVEDISQPQVAVVKEQTAVNQSGKENIGTAANLEINTHSNACSPQVESPLITSAPPSPSNLHPPKKKKNASLFLPSAYNSNKRKTHCTDVVDQRTLKVFKGDQSHQASSAGESGGIESRLNGYGAVIHTFLDDRQARGAGMMKKRESQRSFKEAVEFAYEGRRNASTDVIRYTRILSAIKRLAEWDVKDEGLSTFREQAVETMKVWVERRKREETCSGSWSQSRRRGPAERLRV